MSSNPGNKTGLKNARSQLITRQDFPQQVEILTKYQFCENRVLFPTISGTWNTESIFIIVKLTGSDCLLIRHTTHHNCRQTKILAAVQLPRKYIQRAFISLWFCLSPLNDAQMTINFIQFLDRDYGNESCICLWLFDPKQKRCQTNKKKQKKSVRLRFDFQ